MRNLLKDKANSPKKTKQTFFKSLDKDEPSTAPVLSRPPGQCHGRSMYCVQAHALPTDNYTYEKIIGSGSYAIVWMATNRKTSQRVAIKIYEKIKLLDPEKLKNVKNEIEILKQLDHPNIIKLHQEFETFRQIHIVMEYIGTTSLSEFLKKRQGKKLTEPEAKVIFKQVASAIHYIHQKEIIHRDIKLENILIESFSNVKLIDFGFAAHPNATSISGVLCGTPAYMSPEILGKEEGQTGYPADIWAMGILLYQLLEGDFPFKGQSDRELFQKVKAGKYELPSNWSEGLKNLMVSLLTLDQKQRIVSGEVVFLIKFDS
jgi:MAP/microtubule affinity-regulating kinase